LRRPLYAIRPGGAGDISLPAGKNSNESIAWCQRMAAPYNPSVLAYRDRLYVLYDKGLFACFDAYTGDVVYDRQRIPNGRAFTSSPWASAASPSASINTARPSSTERGTNSNHCIPTSWP